MLVEMMVFEEDAACMGIPDGFCIVNLFNLDASCCFICYVLFFCVYICSCFNFDLIGMHAALHIGVVLLCLLISSMMCSSKKKVA